ncbi:uncharacterized protein CIMG_12846 [Coccidioides immitis RS]|uniref:Uncharacterized protein n=1 Tax=Coccidioides immitis (strain RS) TaxID=246410 RepID=J3KHM2_COCIM|nr:uncharacterized protein CIMG_12846 [Coccidioides immitis RS]EAS35383.3 hypothetical protein CIMG_12846 [Coccidioides immitis RS]
MNIAGSVMVMAYCKHITVNTDDIKLILDISAKIRLNYFSPIDVSDCSASAATTCHLHAVSTSSTTTAIFLPSPGTIRVSVCQITDIRAPVWFTKPVLEKQKEKKKEKKKKKKKNNDNDEDNNNND